MNETVLQEFSYYEHYEMSMTQLWVLFLLNTIFFISSKILLSKEITNGNKICSILTVFISSLISIIFTTVLLLYLPYKISLDPRYSINPPTKVLVNFWLLELLTIVSLLFYGFYWIYKLVNYFNSDENNIKNCRTIFITSYSLFFCIYFISYIIF